MKYMGFFLSILLIACKEQGGTETGNPIDLPAAYQELETYKIVNGICHQVNVCFSRPLDAACFLSQTSQVGYAMTLGFPSFFQTLTLNEVFYVEAEGAVVADFAESTLCLDRIQDLSCADVQQGVDSVSNSYKNLSEILPRDCQNVFSP